MLVIDDAIVLRTWAPDDAPTVMAAYQDPAIRQWNQRSLNEHEAQELIAEWVARWDRETGAYWAVTRRADGAVLGRIGIREIVLTEGTGEISYWTMPDARGLGMAPRAVGAVSTWAFEVLGLHRLELHHSTHNVASCRVAVKAHFELEGTLRSALLHSDGWHDMHVHARINPKESEATFAV